MFRIGDKVLRRAHFLSDAARKFNAKLAEKFEGLFKIIEVKSPRVYVLEMGEGKTRRIAKVHVSQLKPYIPPIR